MGGWVIPMAGPGYELVIMLTAAHLSEKQQAAITHLYERDESMLWADVGTGKTVIVLTALQELYNAGVITGGVIRGAGAGM